MKIIIVPHTHWDREWYFTSETSQVLWNFNLDNYLNHDYPITKFYLDGQVSLVEDYLNHATLTNKNKFIELIKQHRLIVGPWYSQPDVFNSLGETTIRNLEVAQKLLVQWALPCTKTLYCPDTFGFSDSLPQIANLFGFKDFVFWRGLAKQANETDTFIWKGIDDSLLNCYRLKFGYWTLGSMFAWNKLNATNIKAQAQAFHDNFIKSNVYDHFKSQAAKQNGIVLFPFGGDQAPLHPLTNAFFNAINELSADEWVIGEFEDFFKTQQPTTEITGILDYGYDSKIHRTITTSRYDFKKLFRENEIALYHQLEPLELYYQHCDPTYVSNNIDIIKQLCLMQAHDVLGGCVTDSVYLASYQKLLDINERIKARLALLLKQLGVQMNLEPNTLLVFNPHVNNDAYNCVSHTIYTTQPLKGCLETATHSVYVLNSEQYPDVDDTYLSNLLIINKAMTPLNLQVINLKDLQPNIYPVEAVFNFPKLYNQFLVSYDAGDLFDADEVISKQPKVDNIVIESKILSFKEVEIIKITGDLKIDEISNQYLIQIVKLSNNDEEIEISFHNHSQDVIVKWHSQQQYSKIKYLQHLGIQNYEPRVVADWKEQGYKDSPLAAEKNSGIIFDATQFICTRGTNEFTYDQSHVVITLFRTTGYLGRPDLLNRPGVASGLTNHHIKTPLGQLLKPLTFHFKLGQHHYNADQKLNSFYKKPLVFQVAANDLIASKMERFVFLTQPFEVKPFKIDLPQGFISSLRTIDKAQVLATVVNLQPTTINFDTHEIKFNQIKRIVLKYEK